MYKVLIVDDEYLEREGLKIIFEERDKSNNIRIVGEASDGKEAIEVARETKPDIIFMDIKMPKMDGLKSIKSIKKELPYVKFIIITAYDEFDYVQQALKLGIKDYLLKPIKPAKAIDTVTKLIEQIKDEETELEKQQRIKDKLNRVMPYIKTSFVFDLIFENIDTLEEIKSRSELFNMERMPSVAMIVDIDEFAQMTQSENEIERQILKKEVVNVVKQFEEDYPLLMVVPMNSDKILVLYFGSQTVAGTDIKDWLSRLGNDIKDDVAEKTPFTVTIGIGKYYSDPRMISKSYNEALTALRQYFLAGNNVVHFEDVKAVDYEEEKYPYVVEKNLVEGIKMIEESRLGELVDDFLKSG